MVAGAEVRWATRFELGFAAGMGLNDVIWLLNWICCHRSNLEAKTSSQACTSVWLGNRRGSCDLGPMASGMNGKSEKLMICRGKFVRRLLYLQGYCNPETNVVIGLWWQSRCARLLFEPCQVCTRVTCFTTDCACDRSCRLMLLMARVVYSITDMLLWT